MSAARNIGRYTATGGNLWDMAADDARAENIDFSAFAATHGAQFPDVARAEMFKLWLAAHAGLLADPTLAYYVQSTEPGLDVADFLRHGVAEFEDALVRESARAVRQAETRREAAQVLGDTSLEHTEFYPKSVTYRATYTEHVPLEVVFDMLTPSTAVPFASFAHMYKYVPSFIPQRGMDVSVDTAVILRRANGEAAFIHPDGGTTALEFTVVADEDVDSVRSELAAMLRMPDPADVVQTGVQGVYYFLGYTFDRYIFADFIMNTPAVAALVSLGEFSVPSRDGVARMYSSEPKVTATLAARAADAQGVPSQIRRHVAEGSNYIRVFVTRAGSTGDAARFVATLARVLAAYIRAYPDTYALYKALLPAFPPKLSLARKLAVPDAPDRDPAVFVANYSRLCPHVPDAVRHGEPVPPLAIEFPRGSGQMYTCSDPVYRYPGVRENTLSNADEYPFIPCCFKTEQTFKPKFVKYYGGERTAHVQIRMITTDKPLAPDFFGVLPPALADLLVSLNPVHSYVRYGVGTGMDTFNTCVATALGTRAVPRQRLATRVNVAVAAQENPGQTLSEMATAVADPARFLDPRHFVRLLETVYSVNIYLFDRSGPVVPAHVHGHYTYVRDYERPNIVVYVHADARRCELVAEWDADTGEYVHTHQPRVAAVLDTVPAQVAAESVGGRPLAPVSPPAFFAQCTAQYIDMFGKTRGVVVADGDGRTAYVELSPVPPLNLPLVARDMQTDGGWFAGKYGAYLDRWVGGVHTALPRANAGTLDTAMDNYRTAQYIAEVFLFKFSQWMHASGSSDAARFVAASVAVDPAFVYTLDGPATAYTAGTEDSAGRFVARSARMVERLLFVLRHALVRAPERVAAYHTRKYFDNYYTSISSFRRSPREFVLAPSVAAIVATE